MIERWLLKDFAPGEGVAHGAHQEGYEEVDWLDVSVPGDVHQALIAADRIPDPFYDRNEGECAWVESREWWYRSTFTYNAGALMEDERLWLIFHGLDTYATVWLNGEKLGEHSNMFREARFDVTRFIQPGSMNTLALCFEPPLFHLRDREAPIWRPDSEGENKRNLMRKAQFGYGWDWGPRLPTVGIWRPVELRREASAAIRGMQFATQTIEDGGRRARVWARVEVERIAGDTPLEVTIRLSHPEDRASGVERMMVLKSTDEPLFAEFEFDVDQPRLWWTHDLGEPALYDIEIRLQQDERELERVTRQVGIRTLELDRSRDPDEPGTSFFRFVLNGVPIFACGANWIPADSFVGGLTASRYEILLEAARRANMNMLRIWGGGIYEHNAFYDLCDRMGILIWQDFMFACAPYPEDDPAFVSEVEQELRYQVRRLRSHPCLALWCGNNENQMMHHWIFPGEEPEMPLLGAKYYDEMMPQTVAELDGFTPYWPGSPYGGPHPNSMLEGDVHDWHVWHGHPVEGTSPENLMRLFTSGPEPEDVSFLHYAENRGRFISEFGMHASPVLETLRRCLPPDQLYHHSPGMDHHNKDNPKNKGDNLMLTVTGLPEDLEAYIDFSMIAQAEGLKFGIEHFRRRKPHCSGTLLWQFNDCWPVLSWSILDYYGFGKAGYYYVRRAYAPVLASFKALEDGAVELWVTNDTLAEVSDTAVVRGGDFAGGTTWEEAVDVQIAANTSQPLWRGEPSRVASGPDRYLSVRSIGGVFPANRHFFVPIKDLERPIGEPEVRIEAVSEHELRVQLHAPAYLFYVHLIVPHERTFFSDNYFDLEGGEQVIVIVTNPHIRLKPEDVSIRWR
jgi:beta-mannosidase